MRTVRLACFVSVVIQLSLAHSNAQDYSKLGPQVRKYVRVSTNRVWLQHVRVVDGTGSAPKADQNLLIENGKIKEICSATANPNDGGTATLDFTGYTVIPGLVGMHNHLFYVAHPDLKSDWSSEPPLLVPQMSFSAPRLYLAGGVTTMRTTGSVEPYADLNLRRDIEAGKLPGPHIDVTGPYLEGRGSFAVQLHELTDAADARRMVNYWADMGATSFKAYMNITRDELKASIEEAHKRHLKVTGHLCSVTYKEAVELGIDNLEHGFLVNTQLDPDKKPDLCSASQGAYTLQHMPSGGPEAKELIALLIKNHVAITSTLPVFESGSFPRLTPLRQEVLDVMSPQTREAYLYRRERPPHAPPPETDWAALLRLDMNLEHEFAQSGGLLLAGPDPTGDGGVVPGFGDQREVELLVEAGFSPVEAIKIVTLNGAMYLGREAQIGSIAPGKNADLLVIKGDPSQRIEDIENVEIVFKDGVGYDSRQLIESVKGRYGEY